MNQRIHKELHLHHCKSPDPDPCQPHLWNSSTTKSTRIKYSHATAVRQRKTWEPHEDLSKLFLTWHLRAGQNLRVTLSIFKIYYSLHITLSVYLFFFLSWALIAPVDFTIPLLSVLVHLEESLLVLLSHVWWALQVHLGTEGNKSTLSWIMLRNNKRDSFLLSQKLTQL